MQNPTDKQKAISSLKNYYKFHSKIYDLSRWTFLFGRKQIIYSIAKIANPKKILEVGCGTGANLLLIHKFFPEAELCGIDISDDMLKIAEKKLKNSGAKFTALARNYDSPIRKSSFDLLIFSYCLSMINPGWENAILAAKDDIKENGMIAVVDFYGTNSLKFQKWMEFNHVKMKYHLPPALEKTFCKRLYKTGSPYFNLWKYFIFVGEKISESSESSS